MSGFSRMATTTASTKRNPAISAGKVGAAVTKLSSLAILPLMPVDPGIIERYRLNSPRETYVTFTEGAPDVLEGDILTVASVDYRVRAVGPWPTGKAFLEMIVERAKG